MGPETHDIMISINLTVFVCVTVTSHIATLLLPSPNIQIHVIFSSIQITSLEAMSHLNPDYKHIERLVLNNNSLSSIHGLESSWLHRNGPSLLDLRNNFIREVRLSCTGLKLHSRMRKLLLQFTHVQE